MTGGLLDGVRVVAFEQAIALPFASYILSELGADVIKIERPPSGDVVRGWDNVVLGMSSGFVAWNAGKRDVTIDVGTEGGRDIVKRLASKADVFLENFAPGVVERLGIGPEALMASNQRLIYCSLSGYGQDGPHRDVKAFDLLIQGESGILMTNGSPDAPAKVGIPITDQMAGSHAAIAICAALYEREKTGEGKFIDIALLESAFFWLGYFPHYAWHGHPQPPRTGMRHQFICPYGPFVASDGAYVNLVVASQAHWRAFCREVVDRPEWEEDERFASMSERSKNRGQLDSLVAEVIVQHERDYWFERLSKAGLPYGRVRDMEEVVQHPQLHHRGVIVEDDSPVGRIPLVRFPLSNRTSRRVPNLGEHNQEVLAELGFSPQQIAEFQRLGVI